jgi:tetratricopeptide (TPR) repeat protein
LDRGLTMTLCLLVCGSLVTQAAAQARDPAPNPASEPKPAAISADDASATSESSAALHAEYRQVVASAIAEFDAGRFAEARALFLRAHQLWPSARTWRTLGMTAFELRQYPRALVELQAALDDPRRPLDPEHQTEVRGLIDQTRAFVGRYRVSMVPPAAALQLDGAEVVPGADGTLVLALGDHALRAYAPGYHELRRVLQVQGREDEALALVLTPLEPSPASARPASAPPTTAPSTLAASSARDAEPTQLQRRVTWSALGLGAAASVVGVVTGGLALQRKRTVEDDSHCPDELCPPAYHDEVDELKRFSDTATATTVIAGVGLTTALVLWLTQRRTPARRAMRHELRLGLGTASLFGRF